jgi:hypothetical protein
MSSPRPAAIYVWLVPSEDVLDQPGSWRIRKWDTEPFPEATFTLSETAAGCGAKPSSYGGGAACDQKWHCEECGDVTDATRCPKGREHAAVRALAEESTPSSATTPLMVEVAEALAAACEDIPPEFARVVDEKFWDLIVRTDRKVVKE